MNLLNKISGKISLVILFLSVNLFSQNQGARFDKVGTDIGLSQKHVMCIYQDYKGLLWIGTQDGLNLFDGYTFRVFRHEPGNENSILDYAVNSICETDTGVFWIGTREGMSKFDLKSGNFTHFIHNPDSSNSLIDNNIWCISKDSEGKLWIGTRNGLSYYNPEKNEFTNFVNNPSYKNSITNNFILSVVEDANKNIWIGGRGGLDRYDRRQKKFFNYKLNPNNPNSISLNGIMTLLLRDGILWIGSYSGLYSINPGEFVNGKINFEKHYLETKTEGSEGHEQHSIRSLFEGSNNTIWVGTYGDGLFQFQPEADKIISYKRINEFGSISEDYIISLCEDEHGVLWLGTSSTGLNKYNRYSERFKSISFRNFYIGEESRVSSLCEDRFGNLWVGTESGNIIKVSSQLSENPEIRFFNTEKFITNYFSPVEIRKIIEDRNGQLWVATFGNGIYLIDPATDKVKKINADEKSTTSLANNFVHTIYESSTGTIWIGTGAGGLNKYNSADDSFIQFKNEPDNLFSISSNEVTSICEDNSGFIWAGTTIGGLNRLDTRTNKFIRFLHDVRDITSIASNRIVCLFKDSKSNLWIGTFGGGLNRWNPADSTFDHFNSMDGLPSNTINSIVEDSFGNLWLSTDKGLSKFNPEQKTFKNYDVNDGLQGNEFLPGASYLSNSDKKIYFGGENGITIFNPSELNIKTKSAKLVFTDFKIFNKSVRPGKNSPLDTNILFATEVRLSHDQNFFTFEFSSLDFNNPGKNQYAYKMEGFNKEWIKAGNQRFATFTNLDPGEYIFRVKASNSDGIWNENGISIKVILLPPWWQSLWAYLLYVILIISILYSFRQYEMKRVKLHNELQLRDFEAKKLKEVDELKSHFFANISHEFRTPLTLIFGLLQKFESKTSDKKELEDYGVMKKNAVQLLRLINQLLELSKIESGNAKLTASETEIVSFVKRIFVSFASYSEQKNLKLSFNKKDINEETDFKLALYIDKDKMEKIISNLISNAVKYTPDGNEIEVIVSSQNSFAEIKVVNTGITISKADLSHLFERYYKVHRAESGLFEGTGIGLALVKELVELHKGSITAVSDYNVTEFIVKLPIGKTHLQKVEMAEGVVETDFTPEFESFEKTVIDEVSREDDQIPEVTSEKDIVLIVEDHAELRKYIRENLEEIYHVVECQNGKTGLSKAIELVPDLILSDVMMPEMDGYALCKKLKTTETTNHIPVILLTAKAGTEDKLEGLELGADDYLIKPFNPDELKLRVRNLIRTREQLRQKFTSEMVLKPADVVVPSSQVQFMDKLKLIIEKNIEDENFGVDKLSEEMGFSRSQLHRKLKAITNQSTTEFMRNFRLHRAAQLILQDAGTMAEIAYKVGFNSQAYFNKSFQELFACSPSEYKKKK